MTTWKEAAKIIEGIRDRNRLDQNPLPKFHRNEGEKHENGGTGKGGIKDVRHVIAGNDKLIAAHKRIGKIRNLIREKLRKYEKQRLQFKEGEKIIFDLDGNDVKGTILSIYRGAVQRRPSKYFTSIQLEDGSIVDGIYIKCIHTFQDGNEF